MVRYVHSLEFCSKPWALYSGCRVAESATSVTVSTNWRMLKKQLIIVSSIEVHRLKFLNV